MKQHDIMKYSALIACMPLTIEFASENKRSFEKPNIIYIITDQQNASMMSCAGNKWLKTPGMDYIAENGIRFTRAYCTNPVCSPSRVSMMTGRFAGIFKDNKGRQVRENDGSVKIPEISDKVKQTTIAAFLKKAGYELIYGGKQHLPKPLSAVELGFRVITNDERGILAEKTENEIKINPDQEELGKLKLNSEIQPKILTLGLIIWLLRFLLECLGTYSAGLTSSQARRQL